MTYLFENNSDGSLGSPADTGVTEV